MRLNPDCIRDVLIAVEQNTTFYTILEFDTIGSCRELTEYSEQEILYHFRQCCFHDFFTDYNEYIDNTIAVKDLTPKAHEFLANIRSDTVWNKTKNISREIGAYSLDALAKIAAGVVTVITKHYQ